MPHFASKSDLVSAIEAERRQLEEALAGLTDEQMTQPGVCEGWSAKDLMAHLVEWEQMLLGWYRAGVRGGVPKTPAPDFSWGQLPALNQRIYEKHHDRSLSDVRADFDASYREIHDLVAGLPEAELLEPRRYSWLGKHALASYVAPNTSSHYAWARKLVRKWAREARR
jgi:uncharacterized protein (TIGR03083 family)